VDSSDGFFLPLLSVRIVNSPFPVCVDSRVCCCACAYVCVFVCVCCCAHVPMRIVYNGLFYSRTFVRACIGLCLSL
jgi:hypothetical protein